MLQKMKRRHWLLAIVLALALSLSLGLGLAQADGDQEATVYISACYDGEYIPMNDGSPMAYVPVKLSELQRIDLNSYDLGDLIITENGKQAVTALHLMIYAHENLYGGKWDDVAFSGSAGGTYFSDGLFGFDQNMNYYYNGAYAADDNGWGATTDVIKLSDGDFVDVSAYSNWSFWMDDSAGFHYFFDGENVTHAYAATVGQPLTVQVGRNGADLMGGSGTSTTWENGYTVYYGSSLGSETGTVTTGSNGQAVITFDAPGEYHLWVKGSSVSSAGYAKVTVSGGTAINNAPVLASGINASGNTANATVGSPWTLDLSTIFTDADGDDLTYGVKVDGADYAAANASYSFTPSAAGVTHLEFKANDGQADSSQTYSVTVTAAEAAFAIMEVSGGGSISIPADGYAYYIGDAGAKTLTVVQTAGGEGSITYQWKKSTSATGNLSNLSNQKQQAYTPDISSVGNTWYACQITFKPTGGSAKTITTDRVKVAVNVTEGYVNGKKPVFTGQPTGGTWEYGYTGDGGGDLGALLTATLDKSNYSSTDTKNLTVKWYVSTDNGSTWEVSSGYGKAPTVSGSEVLALYELPVGSYKFKCEATLAMKDLAGTTLSAATESNVADVTITSISDWEGQGTETEPYLLKTTADLALLSQKAASTTFSGVYFKFVNDITLPESWTPIGTAKNRFAGNIDGDNHRLTVPAGEKALLGCTQEASLKNLNILGTQINGNGVVDIYTTGSTKTCITIENVTLKSGSQTLGSGFISGYASGTHKVIIRNCTVEDGVTVGYDGTRSNVGSFGGDFNGTIENCVSHATVKGVNYVGGICGNKGQSMGDYTIANCAFHGQVVASGNYAGGISGGGYGGTQWGVASAKNTTCAFINNCLVTGTIQGTDHVGGILGSETGVVQAWENGPGYVQDNLFAGTLSATAENASIGGIIGYYNGLDRFNYIENNYYLDASARQGIGGAQFVDTSCAAPTPVSGVTYYNTENGKPANAPAGASKTKHNRTDDPLGVDADKLARAVTAQELKDGSVTALLNSSTSSLKNWVQGSATPVHLGSQPTIDVTVAAYDYTAHDAGLTGSSASGVVMTETTVTLWAEAKAGDAFIQAFTSASIPYTVDSYGYFSSINGLGPDAQYPQSGWVFSINDSFSNLGTKDQPLAANDRLEMHYSLVGYGTDVGNFFSPYVPTISSYTLAGVKKDLTVVTTSYADWVNTFTDTVEYRVDGQPMVGCGSAQSPFIIPVELPAGTDVSALRAEITTDLHPNYWSLVSGEGQADITQAQNYSQPVSFAIQTRGGVAKTYYQVQIAMNHPPVLAAGVNASGNTANATVGSPWTLDLSTIFTDADGDDLTYGVKVDGADYAAANASYSFTPSAAGVTHLEFKANDGQADSSQTYSVTVTAAPTITASITLSMQENNRFLLAPQGVTVSSDLAESYGYSDSVFGQVSALDALVRAHELLLADDFTVTSAGQYLAVSGSGYVTKLNGKASDNFLFAVDGDYPNDLSSTYSSWTGYTGYTVNQAPVADSGSVEFLVPQDTDMYMDCYTWFQQGGQRISKLTVRAGQSFSLELQGYIYAFGGAFVGQDRVNNGCLGPMPQVQLATADPESGELTGLDGKKTDNNGLVTIVFDEPGVYYLSAAGPVSVYNGRLDTYVFSPWLEVTVLASSGPDEVSADWKDFRNSDVNMAITAAPTPTSAETATQLWANKLGQGWTATPSPQIIVDDSLIVMCGAKLYKLDLASGEVKAQADMAAAPSFSYTPPTYGQGMIFCPLGGGTVQAFDAKTLESLWVYTDPLKGQALSPITYSDGYIYTGFWNGETADAAYVCLSVTDEDRTRTDETKSSAWRDVVKGGFYWAGSLVLGDHVIYGTDNGLSDGNSAGSHLISRHRLSGALVSSLELNGDQRSSVAYAEGRVYCTTKGGCLYSAALDPESGVLSGLKGNDFGAQSTSTPVVYKGRVYLGCGSGISSTGSGGNILVCDADSLETLFAVGLQGYPQCSLLLSTAYEASEGYVYLYSTYNNNPGGLSLIKVKPDAVSADDAELIEVFIPEAKNYCVSSVICGKDGTLYYKNDSGNVFAVRDLFAITTQANGHGTVTVKAGQDEVAQAAAGTELTVTVTANAGWELHELKLNGEKLTVSGDPTAGYTASFTMPAQNVELEASYTQLSSDVEVVEESAKSSLSDAVSASNSLTAAQKAAALAVAQGAASNGLPTAADALVHDLISANPNQEIKIVLRLVIAVTGVKIQGDAITELTLDITPWYELYLNGADEPAESKKIENSQLKRSVTVSLPLSASMSVSDHTRILHKGNYIKPAIDGDKMTFSVSSFSTFTVLADARVASVAFDPAGGKLNGSATGSTIDFYPTDIDSPLPTPSREGFVFKGWYSRANGEGSAYSKVSAALPDRLYAFWEQASAITVSFRLIGDWKHDDDVTGHSKYVTWIATTNYQLAAGSTVYDVFVKAIADAGLSQQGASANYVKSVKAPAEFGAYWLAEFDNGRNSGWMYTVNGSHPDQGLKDYVLKNGDKVIWHYVDDYELETESKWNGGSTKYLNRWLEAEDISPAQYINKYGNISLILRVGAGGTVSPSGEKLRDYLGKDVTFTITPNAGYRVQDVVVDGKSMGAVTSYTYRDLSLDSRITVSFAPISATLFPDVPSSHWAYVQINAAAAQGLFSGYPNGCFYPESTLSRAMLATILYRLEGAPAVTGASPFSDVPAGQWYSDAVIWAANGGVVKGMGDGTFAPQALITREQMAAMLMRYAQYKGLDVSRRGDLSGFSDKDQISAWALPAMGWAYAEGLITGRSAASLAPQGNTTRAEAATILVRYTENVMK